MPNSSSSSAASSAAQATASTPNTADSATSAINTSAKAPIKRSNFTALSHGFSVLAWAMLSLSQKKPLLVLGLPGIGLFATGAAMGLSAVNEFTDSVDSLIGPGLTAIWIGVLGLSMMATGLVLQSARNFIRHLLIREFGLDWARRAHSVVGFIIWLRFDSAWRVYNRLCKRPQKEYAKP